MQHPPKKREGEKRRKKRERKGNLNKWKTKETYILLTPLRPPLRFASQYCQHPWLQGLPLRPIFYLPMRFIHLLPKFPGSILNTGRVSINCTYRSHGWRQCLLKPTFRYYCLECFKVEPTVFSCKPIFLTLRFLYLLSDLLVWPFKLAEPSHRAIVYSALPCKFDSGE